MRRPVLRRFWLWRAVRQGSTPRARLVSNAKSERKVKDVVVTDEAAALCNRPIHHLVGDRCHRRWSHHQELEQRHELYLGRQAPTSRASSPCRIPGRHRPIRVIAASSRRRLGGIHSQARGKTSCRPRASRRRFPSALPPHRVGRRTPGLRVDASTDPCACRPTRPPAIGGVPARGFGQRQRRRFPAE
jgi:hypothetical protein